MNATARPAYRLVTRTRAVAIPILRDPLTVADEISAEVHRIPTAVRRADALRAVERRDLHLSTARAALLALGLSQADTSRLMDEVERLTEGK